MGKFHEDVKDQIVAIRETLVDGWNDLRLFVLETWPALTILFLILVAALWFANPAPPRHVYMATGAPGTSFEVLGKKYAEYFAERGITLHLVPTEGSLENVKRLQDPKDPVMAGFVMTGTAAHNTPRIQTLGSINYQPLWCFYRSSVQLPTKERTAFLLGNLANLGPPNSGTALLTQKVLELNGVNPDNSEIRHMAEAKAINELAKGSIESMCIVDSYDSPNVQKLLNMDGLQLFNFSRAMAYSRRVPALEKVVIPEGGLSLIKNWPQQPMTLVSATTEILIDERLHPAIQTLFLMAASSINGKQSFFSDEGEFPSFKDTSQHRSHEAEVFYEKGSPWLMQFMPFWLAEFVRRLTLMMLPFFAFAYPLLRSMPNYHKNRVRGRINRMYGALKFFEQSLVLGYNPDQKGDYLVQLDGMEKEALSMKVPKSVAGDYYTLRSAIDFVRNRLQSDGYHVQAVLLSEVEGSKNWEDGGDEDV